MSQNNDVLISVVTVVLNAVDQIEKSLYSVFSQEYEHIEFILIDGGSTDGTVDVLQKHRNCIDILVSEPDRGLYHAMNKGIKEASGDFLYFLNSDDFFCDENVVADIAEVICHDSSVDIVYGDVLQMSRGDLVHKPQVPVLNRESLCRWGISHQAIFARRELLLRTGGFSEDYRIVADGDWLAKTLKAGVNCKHISRDIAKISMNGLSSALDWRGEKRKYLRQNYTAWELFKWRKLPGIFGRKGP